MLSKFRYKLLVIIVLATTSCWAHAAIRLPSLISNNMVLQQKTKVALWGWASAGEKVSITSNWNNKTTSITADANGKWLTYITTSKAGGPYTITFKGSNEIKVSNVMLGEVWLASGQSNMEFFVAKTSNASYTGVIDFEKEMKEANFPNIRQIDVANKNAGEPQDDFKGDWKMCSPQTVDTFSAVAYYFAKKLYNETGFPIGIINSTWGGTVIESWMKRDVLVSDADFKPTVDKYEELAANYSKAVEDYNAAMDKWRHDTTKPRPASVVLSRAANPDKARYRLYNAMIAPLAPYTLRGVIWYQGENNAPNAIQYRRLFPAMISSWRSDFKNPDLPFYFVQISPHRSQNPEIRDAQFYIYRTVAHTGMEVTTDNGDSLNIHPRNKKLVGERLALWPLHNEYGKKDIVYSGPLYKSMKVDGNKIRVRFDYVDGGLISNDGQDLKEFTIAGDDKKFVAAKAMIEGNEVVVWSDNISKPAAVRFAWKNIPNPNFYNKAGLPASPFRTDAPALKGGER